MVNVIWCLFIIIGISGCILNGKIDILASVILDSTKESLDMVSKIFPVMALWLGVMNVALKSGLLEKVAIKISPILHFLFPELDKSDETFGYIASNIVANLFGLGNAATPFGIKAMESMQRKNPKKDEATRSMITFLVINTTGLTIVPTTIIALRMFHGSNNPTEIVLACFLATSFSTISALVFDRIFARRSFKK